MLISNLGLKVIKHWESELSGIQMVKQYPSDGSELECHLIIQLKYSNGLPFEN